ncbi:MAG TPA: helicase-related protein [Candidatus Lokiarchaeia archaeon]|nr:helicase-related protein [Candidatus Lokiarchaeia archaeon]
MAASGQCWVNHPFLVPDRVEERAYQVNIARAATKRNTLVVLPTALGKTTIAVLVAIQRLAIYPWGKIIILAPTRPLVMQHYKTFRALLTFPEEKFALMTGRVSGPKRAYAYYNAQFLFSTPQVIANDLELKRVSLEGAVLVVFDEAHKARKRYAYTKVAEAYMSQNADPRILGLTASPGKNHENVELLLDKLFIEHVEFRSEDAFDVREYVHPITLQIEKVNLPAPYWDVLNTIEEMLAEWSEPFFQNKLLEQKGYFSKMAFLELAEQISVLLSNTREKFKKVNYLHWMTKCASCISLIHAKELLISQGVQVCKHFLNKVVEKAENGNAGARNLLANESFLAILDRVNREELPDHPKIGLLQKIIVNQFCENPTSRIIIFAQYRQTVQQIISQLAGTCIPARFVGQASHEEDPGMCQEVQQDVLAQFRQGTCNVLVATSVAEEGLDIPEVDLVIFYEAVPSEIRLIQRRGRTGRKSPGNCIILATATTFDERFLDIAFFREGRMLETLQELVRSWTFPTFPRTPLQPPPSGEKLDYYDFVKQEKERRAKLSETQLEKMVNLLGGSQDLNNGSNQHHERVQSDPLLASLSRRLQVLKIRNALAVEFYTKAGKFLVMTLASTPQSGIPYEELLELSQMEEFEREAIDQELAKAVKQKIFEILPGNVYRIAPGAGNQ